MDGTDASRIDVRREPGSGFRLYITKPNSGAEGTAFIARLVHCR